jgi:MOSC domain-containing protein YiiM
MHLPALSPEWLGANLLIHGLPNLTQLPPGSRLIFANGVVLYVTHYNTPCSHPGKVIQANYPERDGLTAAFVKAAQHRRGLVAVVDQPGRLNEGEVFQVFPLKYYEYQPERDRG